MFATKCVWVESFNLKLSRISKQLWYVDCCCDISCHHLHARHWKKWSKHSTMDVGHEQEREECRNHQASFRSCESFCSANSSPTRITRRLNHRCNNEFRENHSFYQWIGLHVVLINTSVSLIIQNFTKAFAEKSNKKIFGEQLKIALDLPSRVLQSPAIHQKSPTKRIFLRKRFLFA